MSASRRPRPPETAAERYLHDVALWIAKLMLSVALWCTEQDRTPKVWLFCPAAFVPYAQIRVRAGGKWQLFARCMSCGSLDASL